MGEEDDAEDDMLVERCLLMLLSRRPELSREETLMEARDVQDKYIWIGGMRTDYATCVERFC